MLPNSAIIIATNAIYNKIAFFLSSIFMGMNMIFSRLNQI